ncbi:MAG: peptidylprolyl isomerase, partial [Gemmatimonadota bacterium]
PDAEESADENAGGPALREPAAEAPGARADATDSAGGLGGSAPLDPRAPELNRTAPDSFDVRFETSEGMFVVRTHRAWAPNGVDRFYNLARSGVFEGARFFRVIEGFVAQFGIPADPRVAAAWRAATIPDDPVLETNTRGRLTFATSGPNSRTTQLFINYGDNARLDAMGFAPIGEVVQGMEVVDRLYAGYGEGAPNGRGPSQARIQHSGNAYLEAGFPDLDAIERTEVDREAPEG